MKKYFFLFLFLTLSFFSFSQEKKAFVLFDKKGKITTYKRLLKASAKADIVLFGEYHNNPIAHWLQLELIKDLEPKRSLILGAEMFERDNQKELNSYLQGTINQKALDSLARLWNNYKTDYKPISRLKSLSAGVGVSFSGVRVDLSYDITRRYYQPQLYETVLTDTPMVKNTTHNILLSFSMKL